MRELEVVTRKHLPKHEGHAPKPLHLERAENNPGCIKSEESRQLSCDSVSLYDKHSILAPCDLLIKSGATAQPNLCMFSLFPLLTECYKMVITRNNRNKPAATHRRHQAERSHRLEGGGDTHRDPGMTLKSQLTWPSWSSIGQAWGPGDCSCPHAMST